MRRTPLQRRSPLARSSSLVPGRVPPAVQLRRRDGRQRPQAERLAGAKSEGNPIPPEVRAAVRERSGGRCEISGPDCTGRAQEQHHRKRRRDGGHGLGNLLDACAADHAYAHAHPAEARAAGWIVSAFTPDPAAIPVRYGDRLTWLHDDGTKTTQEDAS